VLKLCQWNNRPARVYARINELKTTVTEFLRHHPGSVLLPGSAHFVEWRHPGAALEDGDCYIQDPSTAIGCELLRPAPGEIVLDACAAPGGKAAYLAQMMKNDGVLVAADRDAARLNRLHENLVRLGVSNARVLRSDWADEDSPRAWTAEPILRHEFGRCPVIWVLRRRVDLRWRLRPDDFTRMPRQQLAILRPWRRSNRAVR
jgi:16S rRNA (cytosine967-C5)-methyltransferase